MNPKQQAVIDYLKGFDSLIEYKVKFEEISVTRKADGKHISEMYHGKLWTLETEKIIERVKQLLLNLEIITKEELKTADRNLDL